MPDHLLLLADAEREYTEQLEDGADNSVNVWWLSAIHLIRGSRDEALDWLERATELSAGSLQLELEPAIHAEAAT